MLIGQRDKQNRGWKAFCWVGCNMMHDGAPSDCYHATSCALLEQHFWLLQLCRTSDGSTDSMPCHTEAGKLGQIATGRVGLCAQVPGRGMRERGARMHRASFSIEAKLWHGLHQIVHGRLQEPEASAMADIVQSSIHMSLTRWLEDRPSSWNNSRLWYGRG